MSEKLRSPSRRALLRAAGMLPFALAGASTLSEETTAEIDGLVKGLALSPEEHTKLLGIVSKLWWMFEAGLTEEKSYTQAVVQRALGLSGPHLITNLSKWPDTPGEDHWATLGCAYECGQKSKELATGGEVTPDIFESAWKAIRIDTMARLERFKRRHPGKPIKGFGLGCG